MNLSIVSTLYKSAEYIEEFHRRSSLVAHQIAGYDYEIIFVNDGSPDNSLDIAISLSEVDEHVIVVDLSRNFGHHKAMMTGLAHAQGEYVFLIDSDLEEEPEWLLRFVEQIEKEKCDVVFGVQKQRRGGVIERWSGEWFYRLFNLFTGMEMPKNTVTARLMCCRYVEALLLYEERELFIDGLWYLTGFNQRPQLVNKLSSSNTSYTFRRKMSLAFNAITSFSNVPLIGIFYIGIAITLLAMVYTFYVVISSLFFLNALSGWTSLIASIWFLSGVIISFIGIIGIYLSKVFMETKHRPFTIIKQIYEKNNH